MYGGIMRTLILMAAALLLLAGCAQIAQSAAGELGTCLDKCQQLCGLVNQSNMSLDGYQPGLTKQSGGVKISCSCTCT